MDSFLQLRLFVILVIPIYIVLLIIHNALAIKYNTIKLAIISIICVVAFILLDHVLIFHIYSGLNNSIYSHIHIYIILFSIVMIFPFKILDKNIRYWQIFICLLIIFVILFYSYYAIIFKYYSSEPNPIVGTKLIF